MISEYCRHTGVLCFTFASRYSEIFTMLRQFSKRVSLYCYIIFCFLIFLASCKSERGDADVSDIDLELKADRFENDLAVHTNNIQFLRNKYGSFLDLYAYQILTLGTTDTVLLKTRLGDFIGDPDITNIYADVKAMYADFSPIDNQLTEAFRHYAFYFSGKIIPRLVTYLSGFNYAIVCADSTLAIGLDMYLGSDSKYYPSLQIPEYKIRKMRKEYITADAMRGWAQSEWEQDPAQTDLLSQVIYQGKIQYFLRMMLPQESDSIQFGYTGKQLEWCAASEKSIWAFWIEHQLLFSTEASQIAKYVNDGPTTNGFPKDSPGNIGAWVGYRIVNAYMEKQPSVSLSQLMADNDSKKIFRDSHYKPAK